MNQKLFKRFANAIFLTLSCFLIVYFLTQLTDSPLIKVGVAIFAIGLDIFLQYILALGRACWRERQRSRALMFFICYIVYACVYAGPSAIGFFAVEINAQEMIVTKTETADRMNRNRITQIDRTLNALNKQLETEASTGYGSRSRAIMAKVDELTREREKLQESLANDPKSSGEIPKNVFRSLAEVFRIPENILKILIFGTSVAMLYLGLILTSWDIKTGEPEEPTVTGQVVNSLPEETATEAEYQSNIDASTQELLKFIGAMYQPNGSNTLYGDSVISKNIGMPLQKCAKYKKLLSKINVNGKPLVVRRKEIVEEGVEQGI